MLALWILGYTFYTIRVIKLLYVVFKSNRRISITLPLKKQLEFTLEYFSKESKDDLPVLQRNRKALEEKIEKMQERYVLGEINPELYHKFKSKFTEEKIRNRTRNYE